MLLLLGGSGAGCRWLDKLTSVMAKNSMVKICSRRSGERSRLHQDAIVAESARMSTTVFYRRRHICDIVEGNNPIPVFIRVRIITVIEGIARCSYGYIGRYRLPDKLFMCVA